jgi:hypothetical protein
MPSPVMLLLPLPSIPLRQSEFRSLLVLGLILLAFVGVGECEYESFKNAGCIPVV